MFGCLKSSVVELDVGLEDKLMRIRSKECCC